MKNILLILTFITLISCTSDPEEQLLLARANINKGAYETARYHLDDLLKSDSTVAEAYMLLGRLENKLNNYKEAKTILDRCLANNPQYVEAYKERSVTNKKLGLNSEAIADLTKLLTLYGEDGSIYLDRGNLYLGVGKLDDACRDWLKAGELGETEALRIHKKFCVTPEFE
jgi:tetratricopeptide (TPR) repeat protein